MALVQDEITSRIEAFAKDITDVLTRAVSEAVSGALAGSGSRASAAGRKKPGPKPGGVRAAKAASDEALQERILKELHKKGGLRVEEIARSLSIPSKRLKAPMAKLAAAKKVTKKGQARGTRYAAVGGPAAPTAPAAKKTKKKRKNAKK